jgi:putative hydrolase of the HAD superfamily
VASGPVPAADARHVDGVLLDIDDTLVDTRSAFRAALGHVLAGWLPRLGEADRERAVRHWALDAAGHFRAFTRGERSFVEQRRLRAMDLHARFGGPVLDEAGFARWDAGYEAAFRGAWRALPDAVALIGELRARGVPFGALTNMAGGYQRDKLAAVGLAEVPVLVSLDDLGRGKPDPAVFRLGCSRLGMAPERVAYVGDELDVDARGARDAGLVGVWLDRHGSGERPTDVHVVADLSALTAVLALPAGRDHGGS